MGTVTVIRGATAAIVGLLFAVALILLLPGQTCMEWADAGGFIRIWPKPPHCP